VAPPANADDLVVENSGDAGISILGPSANTQRVVFGTPGDNNSGEIMHFYNSGGPYLTFETAGTEQMRVHSNGTVGIRNNAASSYANSAAALVVGDTADATTEITIATSTSGVAELNFTDTADTTNQAGLSFNHGTGWTRYFSTGSVGIQETSNASSSYGLTINQSTLDNEILTLKSSDVAHGMTSLAETDTYGNWQKHDSTGGGCTWVGYTATTAAINIIGRTSDNSTLKSTSARGCIETYSQTKSGTSVAAMGTDANLLVMRNASTTRFIFDAEGSGHADVEWTTFSDSRLKKNVIDCPYGLAEVLQLEPKAFDKHSGKIEDGEVVLEENSRRMIGFLAQDVKALMPELVKDLPDDQSFYSLNDGKLAAVLVNAIQELNAKLEAN